jgi:peptidoglycan/xylan/chitin deacetylase (PgdA/CDA1 family)
MIAKIQNLVRLTDSMVARAYLSLFDESASLMCFMFHSLFRDESEIARNVVDPLQRTTIAQLRCLIEHYLEHGYQFVGPQELLAGLPQTQKLALLTFDDGYCNNHLAAPILAEFRVPAFFFISTDFVKSQRCYWWDVLYRELATKGASESEIYHEGLALKSFKTERIEELLTERFGEDAFLPRCDIDRPFNEHELQAFAQSHYVHLGNHTAHHAILTNYSPEEIGAQLKSAQDEIEQISGKRPVAIAYPNGGHDERIIRACKDVGLKIGFTIRPQKTRLPVAADSPDLMQLGRFCPHGEAPIETQCRTYRSDVLLYGALRKTYLRIRRGQVNQ